MLCAEFEDLQIAMNLSPTNVTGLCEMLGSMYSYATVDSLDDFSELYSSLGCLTIGTGDSTWDTNATCSAVLTWAGGEVWPPVVPHKAGMPACAVSSLLLFLARLTGAGVVQDVAYGDGSNPDDLCIFLKAIYNAEIQNCTSIGCVSASAELMDLLGGGCDNLNSCPPDSVCNVMGVLANQTFDAAGPQDAVRAVAERAGRERAARLSIAPLDACLVTPLDVGTDRNCRRGYAHCWWKRCT